MLSLKKLFLTSQQGASMVLVAGFIALVVAPLLAFSIEIGRYAESRVLIQQAADLAALAAVQEADVYAFEEYGIQVLKTDTAQSVARDYIRRNLTFADAQRVSVNVRSVEIAENIATSYVDADVSELFPRFIGHVTIHVLGTAEFRFTRDGVRAPLP